MTKRRTERRTSGRSARPPRRARRLRPHRRPRAPAPPPVATILSPRGPEPVGPYPHARRVGNLLFLSGMGPRERDSKVIPGVRLDAGGRVLSYDIAEQCRAVFRNVRAVLEDAGSSWERIVDVTVYLTNLEADFPIYNRVYAEHFTTNRPARTTIGVTRLPTPIAVELKVVATVD